MPLYTAAHWGIYQASRDAQGQVSLQGLASDPNPSPIGLDMLAASRDSQVRVARPAIRLSWLERYRARQSGQDSPPPLTPRGQDSFVEVSWEQAIHIVATELRRVRQQHGNSSIFGGSYGWSSAGRFHHAQSQVHRFLNMIGGYVAHKDSYSLGAGRVITPYIVASMDELIAQHTSWDQIVAHTELFVCFGGIPEKSAQVSPGGAGDHMVKPALLAAQQQGVEFINISPIRSSLSTEHPHQWLAIRPTTDTALMLALAYHLYDSKQYDQDFLNRYTVGFEKFSAYLCGQTDGVPKTPAWAQAITGIDQQDIIQLAEKMASKRTMLNATWSLQRADHGEQTFWMLITLASMLGQIGLPGGGFGLGYGSANTQGSKAPLFTGPTLDQGKNAVDAFIPVARIADMLLQPGTTFSYQGRQHQYPDIRLVYWAGGNPFHHHQDLNRLVQAWQKPETIIVHESYWTSTARHADIILPATTSFERNDIAYSKRERYMAYMSKLYEPLAEAKDDYSIFSLLAAELGVEEAFTEGRDSEQWVRHLYDISRQKASASKVDLPDFDTFTQQGLIDLYTPEPPTAITMLENFRTDPVQHKLKTASGKIEITCSTIESYQLEDCLGHPAWFEPTEWLHEQAQNETWLHLLSDQPSTKLHSQLDHSSYSRADKPLGREPVYMHPLDAQARNLHEGQIVLIHNDRGACLGSLQLTTDLRRGVIRQSTGSWFTPTLSTAYPPSLEAHGNPNVLTRDMGSSSLSQGCSAYSCLVKVSRFTAPLPALEIFQAPLFHSGSDFSLEQRHKPDCTQTKIDPILQDSHVQPPKNMSKQ